MKITPIFLLFCFAIFAQNTRVEPKESDYYSFHRGLPYISDYEIEKCLKVSAEFNYLDTGDIWIFGAYDSLISSLDNVSQDFFYFLLDGDYLMDKDGKSGKEVTERALNFRDSTLVEDENGVLHNIPMTSCLNRFFDKVIIEGIKVKLFDSTVHFQPQIIYFSKPKNRETFSIFFQEFKKASFLFCNQGKSTNLGFNYNLYITQMLADNYEIIGDGEYVLDVYLDNYLSNQVVFDSITHTLYWGVDSIYPPKSILKKYYIKHFYGAGIDVNKSPCFLWDIKTLESVNLRDNLITEWKDYSFVSNALKTIYLGNNPISKREKKRMRRKLKGVEINFN